MTLDTKKYFAAYNRHGRERAAFSNGELPGPRPVFDADAVKPVQEEGAPSLDKGKDKNSKRSSVKK